MDVYQINLCGFDKAYMQRLSIVFKKKMGELLMISVWDTVPEDRFFDRTKQGTVTIWLGGEDEIRKVLEQFRQRTETEQKQDREILFLTLVTGKKAEQPDEIYAYQSADAILDRILSRALSLRQADVLDDPQHLSVKLLIDIGERRALLPCGIAYAQEAGTEQRVLLIDLIPCSGILKLLESPAPEMDFADLILSMRRKKQVHLSEAVIRTGNIEILPAACNPTVLYEFSAEDIANLLKQAAADRLYDMAVVLAGTPFPGIRQLFQTADRLICLQDDGTCSASRRKELYAYYCYAGGDETGWKDVVLEHPQWEVTKTTGTHLLYEWANGIPAGQMKQVMDL